MPDTPPFDSRSPAETFGDLEAEFVALMEGAGLVDLSHRDLLSIAGDDRVVWLQGLCTQDILAIEPLGGAYACHINIKGRIVADFRVVNLGDFFLLDTEPGMGRTLRRALKHFVIREQVRLRERTLVTGQLGLVGPRALGALGAELAELPLHGAAAIELAGVEVLAVRTDQFGGDAVRLIAPRESLPTLWSALSADAAPVGSAALEAHRILHGRPLFGVDFGTETLFNDAGLADAVSFSKGCYLGQEIVERVDSRNRAQRQLVAFRHEGDGILDLQIGATVRFEGRDVGRVTSFGASVQRGLAMVRREAADSGSVVEIELAGEASVQATVG